ncbi:TonB-dependent receptor [Shewanella corallii]|uniref:TonB-dependent receptor n=1 Tax=Shewanella corallii TaxID=560080 RepID=A0ABT0N3E2_9GAMM|nr:TonB-dependent receptor [Shewanella corallii]MCL2912307.1 TonB-dependent receptor [Shewanella corallii]
MSLFKPSLVMLALAAAGVSSMNIAVAAEQSTADEPVEVIEVRGIRGSLAAAQATKMDNSSIVESISAEDIGKLPDNSIAESLARLPGLTTQRLNGRANVVSIRGLAPDFTTATLNGREQVTVNENRGIEFDQYPSELINSAVVYKTPDASLMAQAIGGTVDLQTIRPLAFGEQALVVNGRYEMNDMDQLNPDVSNKGYRSSISYIDQFLDDTLGVAIGFSSMSSPSQNERSHVWGYPEAKDLEGSPLVISGYKPYVQSSELQRDGVMAVIEFAPNDKLHSIVDIFYTNFEDNYSLRGAEMPLYNYNGDTNTSNLTNAVVENGMVTSGTFSGVNPVLRNDFEDKESDLVAVGWNLSYDVSDNLTLAADLSYSKADTHTFSLESYSGFGRGGSEAGYDVDFVMSENGAIFDTDANFTNATLGNPQNWGIPGNNGVQDGFINDIELEDELSAVRLTANYYLGSGIVEEIEFGVNYTNREKTKDYESAFLQLKSNAPTAVPGEFLMSPVDLGFIGIGPMLTYDPRALFASGIYNVYDAAEFDAWRNTKSWSVTEEVITPYVQANLYTEIGDMPLKGNVGLQAVYTDQSSDGFTTVRDDADEIMPISGGTDYWELLPSLNLSLEVADDQYVRLGIARTLARARMDQMNASREINYNPDKADSTDIDQSPWSGYGGNAELKPWMAWQFDLSYENYFSGTSYFAVAVFYKDLENYIFNQQTIGDFSGYPIEGEQPALTEGYVGIWQNGQGGYIWGSEVTLALTGDLLHDSLSGFGMSVNYSYTDSEVQEDADSDPIPLPGLSNDVVNASFYYEDYGFQARVSARYRSDFLGEVSGLSLARDMRFVASETIVDAQIGYDFAESGIKSLEGLSVVLQGLNLTDEPFMTYENGDERQIKDYQSYGRTFMLGASYAF